VPPPPPVTSHYYYTTTTAAAAAAPTTRVTGEFHVRTGSLLATTRVHRDWSASARTGSRRLLLVLLLYSLVADAHVVYPEIAVDELSRAWRP